MRVPPMAVPFLCLVLAATGTASAQDPDVARLAEQERALRARVAQDDTAGRTATGARCELGFVLVRLDRAAEAIPELDRGIAELGTPVDRATRLRLASCLYNRGRAAEDVGDLGAARTAYRRSLALRPNATVQARLDALPREAPEELAARAALDACRAQPDHEQCVLAHEGIRTLSDPAGASEVSWMVVATTSDWAGTPCAQWYAIAIVGGVAAGTEIYAYCNGNREDVQVTPEIRPLEGVERALIARYESRWYESAGNPEGSTAGVVVAWPDAAGLSSVHLATHDEEPPYDAEVAVDAGGWIVVTRIRGRVPDPMRRCVGRHTAADLRRRCPR